MHSISLSLDYIWEPFTCKGKHLSFAEHRSARLSKRDCSHWGPVVYKWQGPIVVGPSGQLT